VEDKTLVCIDCGNEFAFTVRDQEFFSSKGFTEPKRCKPCRIARKNNQNNKDIKGAMYRPKPGHN